jgi:hypothetical protein
MTVQLSGTPNNRYSHRWSGWVWEISSWSSRPQKKTHHFRGIYRIYLKFMKENSKIAICNWLDLGILGFWSILSKNVSGHCDVTVKKTYIKHHWGRPQLHNSMGHWIGLGMVFVRSYSHLLSFQILESELNWNVKVIILFFLKRSPICSPFCVSYCT